MLPRRSLFGRPAAATILALALCLLSAPDASAHVSITPAQVPVESNQTFAVRVPTEKNEPTVRVRLTFPAGLTVSRFQPKAGWTRQVEQDAQQRIISVTWSGGQIGPGEFEDFVFIGRTPREAGKLAFQAYQTYQGGETVEWTGGEGADRPGPTVALTAAGAPSGEAGDGHGTETGGAASKPAAGASPTAAQAGPASVTLATPARESSGGSDLPLFAALGALVLALIALALSGVALSRRPHSA